MKDDNKTKKQLIDELTELRSQNDALKESESADKYRSLVENIRDVIYELDSQGVVLYISPAIRDMLEYDSAEIIGKNFIELAHKDDQSSLAEWFSELRKGIEQPSEYRVSNKSGEIKWARTKTRPIMEDGLFKGARGILLDVTAQRRVEEALRESEELFRSYLEYAPDGVYMNDMKGNFLYGNRKCEEIIGYRREELIGKNLLELNILPEKYMSKAAKLLQDNIDGRSTGPDEFELISKEGRLIPVEISTSVVQRMGQRIVLAFIRDITDRKRSEESLRKSEERLRDIMFSTADWVWEVDKNGVYTYGSQKGVDLLGETRGAIIGKTPFDFMPPDEAKRVAAIFSEIVANKAPIKDLENWNIDSNSKRVCLLTNGVPILDKEGNLEGYRGIDKDITDRKRAEEALKQSEELYRTFLESTMDMVLLKDDELRHIMVNKPLLDFMGKEENEIIGKTDAELLPQSIAQVCQQTDMKVIQSGAIVKTEEPMHDGIYETRKFPVSIGGGKVGVGAYIRDITDRKRAEEALQESREKYRTVADFTYDWEYWLAPDGKYIYISPACERISGYRIEEFQQDPNLLEKMIHPDDRSLFACHIQDVLPGKSDVCELEFRIFTRDGQERWIGHVCQDVYGHTGEYLGRRGSNLDITDRKKANDALQEGKRQLKAILDNIPDIAWLKDKESRFISVNEPFGKSCGFEPEDLVGKTDLDIWPGDLAERYRADDKEVMESGKRKQVEEPLTDSEGKSLWIETTKTPIYDTQKNFVGTAGIARDITERKRAEEKLRQQTDAMDAAFDGMALLNEEGEYVYLNRAHAKVYGYENAEELIGKSWRILYDSDVVQRFEQEIMPELSRRGDWFGESIGTKKNGGKFPQELSLTAMANGGLICVVRDITDRERVAEQLQHTLESLRKALNTTIQVMVSAVERRDPYTAGHQLRSTDLARAIATEMGLSQDTIEAIRMAGPIHDIGKISIPAEILSKPTKLTNIEFSLIKEHARTGYEMLKDVESPWPLAEIVYQHHERMDGTGYPRNLKGDEILIEARIMAIADVVESMASHRPYRPALGLNAALEEIENHKGTLYDADAADACLRLFRQKGFQLEGTTT